MMEFIEKNAEKLFSAALFLIVGVVLLIVGLYVMKKVAAALGTHIEKGIAQGFEKTWTSEFKTEFVLGVEKGIRAGFERLPTGQLSELVSWLDKKVRLMAEELHVHLENVAAGKAPLMWPPENPYSKHSYVYRQIFHTKNKELIPALSTARLLRDRSDYTKAMAVVQKLHTQFPGDIDILLEMSALHQELREFDQAIHDADAALRSAETNAAKAEVHFRKGLIFKAKAGSLKDANDRGRALEESLAACQSALRLQPQDPRVHNAMSFVLWCLQRLDDAIASAKLASAAIAAENPHDAELSFKIQNNYAYYLAERGRREDFEEALGVVRKLLEVADCIKDPYQADTIAFVIATTINFGSNKDDSMLIDAYRMMKLALRLHPSDSTMIEHMRLVKSLMSKKGVDSPDPEDDPQNLAARVSTPSNDR